MTDREVCAHNVRVIHDCEMCRSKAKDALSEYKGDKSAGVGDK